MKNTVYAALGVALFTTAAALAGCGDKTADTEGGATAPATTASAPAATAATPVATANPQGSVKVGDKAVCAVCAVKEGTNEKEEVKAVLDYKGKTYVFCNEAEKAEFISDPAKYAQAQ